MTTINQPKVTTSIIAASTTAENTAQKILFVGQKTVAGSAGTGTLYESIANGGAEDDLFGATSMLAALIRANKIRNQQVQIDAITLNDDGGGTASEGIFTITGAATEDGELVFTIGSDRNHKYSIAVTSGDTPTIIGDAVDAAVLADLNSPVTSANVAGVVTVTAVNAGTYGDSFPIGASGGVDGVSIAVTGMTGGATDPTLTGVFDPIGDRRYQAIVWPYPEDTTELLALLDPRFNADGAVLDGVGFTAINDTFSNLVSLGDGLNSQSLLIIGGKQENTQLYKGGDIVEIPMVKAAQFAGYRGLRLDTDGFSIADLVITANGPLDAFGGPGLASKPYFNTPFADLSTIVPGRGFDATEIESLKDSGVSVLGNNLSASGIISGEMVTTYKTDVAANPDPTFTFLNYVDTASQTREYFSNNYRKRFAQSRLTEGDIIKGRDMANAVVMRSFSKRLYQDLSGDKFILFEAGEKSIKFFNDNLIVTIDKVSGKISNQMEVLVVTQVRGVDTTMKIAFSINA